ncbi:hypothetical protein GCM10010174_31570 [Kutzneria viridogrisea]|uniref:Uncharacterized protein n=3 Tax=Pseudonocardiaceae TaxID=2070 RepID=W5VXC9_9PSEU|nr:hypothetical protein [Kutzneria albida]AHH93498.1 hypothetical protein KALB_121 [Kutzneria albida DSM 43870]MBA8929116.1 hypothetical protein [Kutzneria viridogrisea]
MVDAVRGHLDARTGEYAGVLGLFLCPASRLPELITELIKAKPVKPVALSLVIDTGLGGVPKAVSIVESRAELLSLRMVEMPAPSDVDEVWLERVSEFVPEDVIRVVEPRRGGAEWLDGVGRVIEHGSWPKIRCGGLSQEAFPSVDQVADFLSVVASGGVSFKATAGLHNAVRHTDEETGFTHHGFLNLLVATARALSGKDVRAALSETDGEALAEEAKALSDPAAHAVRGVFASYGSCSLGEPVADLEKLGLL